MPMSLILLMKSKSPRFTLSTRVLEEHCIIFVNIDNEDVDFTKSAILTLDRNTSFNHRLSFHLPLEIGYYAVFVYDIESDGTLSNGVGYPASEVYLTVSNSQGINKYIIHYIKTLTYNYRRVFSVRVGFRKLLYQQSLCYYHGRVCILK